MSATDIGEQVLTEIIDGMAEEYIRFVNQYNTELMAEIPFYVRPLISEDTIIQATGAIKRAIHSLPPEAKRKIGIRSMKIMTKLTDQYAHGIVRSEPNEFLTDILAESNQIVKYRPYASIR